MLQQELQLRLLEQQHLKRLHELERERYMLDRENPFKHSKENKDTSNIPILKNDHQIERILYGTKKHSTTSEKKYKYVRNQIDSKIAQKSIFSIMNNWHNETKYIFDDVYLRNIQKQERQVAFDKQLTELGKHQMQQMIIENRKRSASNFFKQKYDNSNYRREPLLKTQKGYQ